SGPDGAWPYGGLIQASDGNFYGTTSLGGNLSCSPFGYGISASIGAYGYTRGTGCGTVFKMDATGNITVLHSFSGQSDGNFPVAALLQASDGTLYGTTSAGGAFAYGTLFALDSSGRFTLLHSFSRAEVSGGSAVAALLQAKDGSIYGTATGVGDHCS